MAKPDLVYVTYIRTTPEKLWAALTTPEFTRQYWGGSANVSSWEKGASWQHTGEDGTVHHVGVVEEVIPLQRLVLSWHNPSETEDISRVTFELVQMDEVVQLNVIHGDFIENSVMADGVSKGWPIVIASMKSYLETGTPLLTIWQHSACHAGCGDKEAAA
ncbi:MAG: SRPBCC family protein [Alphaproteobacteria bacterium]|nr:SRPBCC family protein [Alphaproteobacteria bacterium]